MSIEELLEIEVTSVSKRPERLLDAGAAIQVITADEIRRSGASRLPEALRLAGNLHVAQKGSAGWAISSRGFNTELANKMLVLIDGRAVYTPLYSGVFWDRQDYLLADLERIEVISGPGGTLWGANAVNGVISVVTKDARDTQGLYWETGAGNELRGFTGLRYGGAISPTVHYRVYAKYSDYDGGRLGPGGDAGDDWHSAQAGFRVDARTAADDGLTVQGDTYRVRETMRNRAQSETSGRNLLGRWTRARSADSEMRLQVYYDHTHLTLPTAALVINGTTLAPAGTFRDDLDTWDIDFQHQFRAGARQQVVWGAGYRFTHDSTRNAPALAFLPSKLDQDLVSAFVQDEITLRDRLGLILGSKVEHNDYTGLEAEPNIRLQWTIADDRMVWAAVSRAVRTPSRIDRDFAQAAPPYFTLLRGSPDFSSEDVVAYELGYRARISRNALLSVSAFHNRYDHVRSTSISAGTLFPLYFANNLEGETDGVELALNLQVHEKWRVQANYTLLREDLRVKAGAFDLNQARNETADPRHQFLLRTALDLPARWELDSSLRWVGGFTVNRSGSAAEMSSYAELEVRLGWHPTDDLELSLVGQNLLHRQHPEYGAPDPNRVELQRGAYLKVAWRR